MFKCKVLVIFGATAPSELSVWKWNREGIPNLGAAEVQRVGFHNCLFIRSLIIQLLRIPAPHSVGVITLMWYALLTSFLAAILKVL